MSEPNARPLMTGADVNLDERDPEFIRANLPMWWLMATVYHRADVSGFENVPDGPVMYVGNHSGGSLTPDTLIFLLAHATYFSVDKPLHALAHVMVTSMPGVGQFVRKLGVVTAGPDAATEIFDRGASVLVYPGGDVDALRPWRQRFRVWFDGRKGFLQTAYDNGVPIVPVVADGGHDTMFVLNDGRRLAKRLRLDKLMRVKSVPLTAGLPFGLSIAGVPPHIPLPTKIRIRVGHAIDLRERYGDDLDLDDAYRYVHSTMQTSLSRLASERVLPPFR